MIPAVFLSLEWPRNKGADAGQTSVGSMIRPYVPVTFLCSSFLQISFSVCATVINCSVVRAVDDNDDVVEEGEGCDAHQ